MSTNSDIDIIIPWVDGNDPDWQERYRKYVNLSDKRDSNTISRYRDWDNLQYLFRGIETYMPWVRYVHFVTNGQRPEWLNLKAPKLKWVKHEDIIPAECLPVFSVRPIELNIHRIPNLSEKFIYFNDDFFVLKPLSEDDFFKNGLPIDMATLNVLQAYSSRCLVMANSTLLINMHFCMKEAIKRNRNIWFKLSYGRFLLKSLSLMQWNFFPGIQDTHAPQPFLKTTYQDVWKECEDTLRETTRHRFRDISDVNQSLMRYWQIASGKIYPQNVIKKRRLFLINDGNVNKVCKAILHREHPLLILNDSDDITQFDQAKNKIKAAFEQILPIKSSFEL